MYVACSTLCFSKQSLEQSLRSIGELHFQKIDLAVHERGPHLKPSEIARDTSKMVQRIKSYTHLPISALNVDMDALFQVGGAEQLRSVARFARLLTVPLLTIPAAPKGSDLEAEVDRLAMLNHVVAAEGLLLTVETHSDTVTADPEAATELCKRVNGLGLTLDPSHYLIGPHRPASFDMVFPYVRHVRLRDSGAEAGQFQVRVGQGQVEYGRIITQLERFHYQRSLSVDIRDTLAGTMPVLPEVRKLKYLLESLV